MSKTKIIAFRVDEEKFNKYSSLNIKERKKFVNKCNELLEKFLSLNVNKSSNENVNKSNVNKSSNENVNKSNVNKLYSDSFNPKKVQAQLKTSTYDENVSLDELLKGLEENEK